MAFFGTTWYVNFGNGSSTGYYAVTAWASNTAKSAGALIRQLATPTVDSERVFLALNSGTTTNGSEPSWTTTQGGKTTDNTITWIEVSGWPAVNGDATNTFNWTAVKNVAVVQGQIIKRNNGASYQICSTAGTTGNGSEPSFSDTAGTTTADNTVTWTSMGVVGNFTGGGAPYPRLRIIDNFASTVAAGSIIFVGDNHAQTQAQDMALTGSGTQANPVKFFCHNHSGSYPPASTDITSGATVATTGFTAVQLIGHFHIHGIQFTGGNTAHATWSILFMNGNSKIQTFEKCIFVDGKTTATSVIGFGTGATDAGYCEWKNCQVKWNDVGNHIEFACAVNWVWSNPDGTQALASGSSVPTTLIKNASTLRADAFNSGVNILLEALDLSQCSGNIVDTSTASQGYNGKITIKDCKMHASTTFAATPVQPGMNIDFIRCHNSANYTSNRYNYFGTETTETTITRTGGATDGTQAQARKVVTTANPSYLRPFTPQPITIWNNTVGSSVTVTVFGIWGGGAVPNNDDIWIDVEYLSDASSPQGATASNGKTNYFTTNAAQSSDSSAWGGSTTAFKMTKTITPQQKGPITIYVRAAAVSTTFYIDPLPVLS